MKDAERAARILAALVKRPGLYYEVLHQAQDVKVMGSWGEPHDCGPRCPGMRTSRPSEHGGCAGWVHTDPDGKVWWTVICGPAGDDHQGVDVASVEEGKAAVDAFLQSQGVLLTGGISPQPRKAGPWEDLGELCIRRTPGGEGVALVEVAAPSATHGRFYVRLEGLILRNSEGNLWWFDRIENARHAADDELLRRGWEVAL